MSRRRRTLRTQLTLMYAGPFLLSAIVLLGVPILTFSETSPAEPGVAHPQPTVPPDDDLRHVFTTYGLVLVVTVIVALILGWIIAGRYLRPLRTITATARDISASSLHRRLGPTGRGDEFTELAQTLDDLFRRLEASFESQRHFVANASHELRTPLTAERALLQVALADPDATVDSLRTACREVLALGAAQERLIESLLTLATSERGLEAQERFDLAEIATTVASSRADAAARGHVRLDVAIAPAPAAGDPRLVESLVANLVDNAVRHNVRGGDVQVSTSTVDGHARLRVTNTGPVVPPEEVERLFQPFQRLGDERVRHGDGHGLGLAIVRAIVRAHGAVLDAWAQPTGGLRVDVVFPVR